MFHMGVPPGGPLAEGNYKTSNISLISVNTLWVTNYDKTLLVNFTKENLALGR